MGVGDGAGEREGEGMRKRREVERGTERESEVLLLHFFIT